VIICTLGDVMVTSCGTPTTIFTSGQPAHADIIKINDSGDFLVTIADSWGGAGYRLELVRLPEILFPLYRPR